VFGHCDEAIALPEYWTLQRAPDIATAFTASSEQLHRKMLLLHS
jgi:hypothetical protein